MKTKQDSFFLHFQKPIEGIEFPEKFTFPFSYDPHPLAELAAQQVQEYLKIQKDWVHNFGLVEGQEGDVIGKMFGVLVVEDKDGEIGFLAAFSGKMANANHHPGFVPPIYDMLPEGTFFSKGVVGLNKMNEEVAQLSKNEKYIQSKVYLQSLIKDSKVNIQKEKTILNAEKKKRKAIRKEAIQNLSDEDYAVIQEAHKEESLKQRYFYLQMEKQWAEKLRIAQAEFSKYDDEINAIKEERKRISNGLQQELFDQYHFLNIEKESKSLVDIFEPTVFKVPPSGAGECAAPKLLQYAFQHDMKPICMAEFWWGASPKSEIRQHNHYYPSCNSKCKPILGHMLTEMEVDENPMLTNPALGKTIETVYEDDYLIVVNKPAEFLSVPGKNIEDSAYSRIKERLPEATGPIIVHRLDMSTSGLMVMAKNKEVHKALQSQFINRTVMKQYIAILDGVLDKEEGFVELPLRVDLDDRPRQLVCYEHGKPSKTKYKRVSIEDGRTRVQFFPITGRTHQLRVHSAHQSGLGMPILGDDLYGKKGDRLYLHAAHLKLVHPISGKTMKFSKDPEF